jgi:hypothetical protein
MNLPSTLCTTGNHFENITHMCPAQDTESTEHNQRTTHNQELSRPSKSNRDMSVLGNMPQLVETPASMPQSNVVGPKNPRGRKINAPHLADPSSEVPSAQDTESTKHNQGATHNQELSRPSKTNRDMPLLDNMPQLVETSASMLQSNVVGPKKPHDSKHRRVRCAFTGGPNTCFMYDG